MRGTQGSTHLKTIFVKINFKGLENSDLPPFFLKLL